MLHIVTAEWRPMYTEHVESFKGHWLMNNLFQSPVIYSTAQSTSLLN